MLNIYTILVPCETVQDDHMQTWEISHAYYLVDNHAGWTSLLIGASIHQMSLVHLMNRFWAACS